MKPRKKTKRVRTRDWTEAHEFAFSHDRARHSRGEKLPDAVLERGFEATTTAPNAVVVSHTGQWAFVRKDGAELCCLIDEKLVEGAATLLAPGDRVLVEREGADWRVRGIAERRTKLSRLALERSRVSEQIIAVNIDLLVVVASVARPRFKRGVVDRYLIAAEVGGANALLCVNKMDLVDAEPKEVGPYRELGLTMLNTSCVTGEGIESLRTALRGKLSVFAGQSGVGKSSLLNVLAPELGIETKEVSEATEKGRHTTTTARLYEIGGDIRIIDTAGVRQLGVWGVTPAELAFYFPEMGRHAAACRFRNCTHVHEPGCAVQAAVEAEEIKRARYQSYLRIRESLKEDSF